MSDPLRYEAEAGELEARLEETQPYAPRDVAVIRPSTKGWYVCDFGAFTGPYEDELVAVVASVSEEFSAWAFVLEVRHIGAISWTALD
jgi:hypothetical protein